MDLIRASLASAPYRKREPRTVPKPCCMAGSILDGSATRQRRCKLASKA